MTRTAAAVLFDLDGVLVDSRDAITGCINHALAAHGFAEHAPAALHRFIGPPLAVAFSDLTGERADSEMVVSCVAAYRARYASASLSETTVVPGIADALGEVGRHRRLAVATSKPLAFAEPLLASLGLSDHFDVVVGPDLDAHSEDKTTTIRAGLDALAQSHAVMIGDRSFDIDGAHACAVPAVGVTWGIGTSAELAAAGAD